MLKRSGRRHAGGLMTLGAALASSLLLGLVLAPPAQAAPQWVNIIASHSGQCVEVVDGAIDAGAGIAQGDCTGQEKALWQLKESVAGTGAVHIVNRNSRRCLEVQGTAIGSPVKQADCTDASNVSFRMVDRGEHVWLQSVSAGSTKCLEVYSGMHFQGVVLRLTGCSGQPGTEFHQRIPRTGNEPAGLPDTAVERVSVTASGGQIGAGIDGGGAGGVSEDGRFVAFDSLNASIVAGDTNAKQDVFVRNRATQSAERVSVSSTGVQGNGDSRAARISADGRYVAFASLASNLAPGDANNSEDVFVRDRTTGVTELISRTASGQAGASASVMPYISADGRYVVFSSTASDLVPGDTGMDDTFVHDRHLGTTERVSVSTAGVPGDRMSLGGSISADGRFVAFLSMARNLTPGSSTNWISMNIFVRDRQLGTTELVSISNAGNQANGSSGFPSISADGRFVAFNSDSENLLPSGVDINGAMDVFVRDRTTQSTRRISVNHNSTESNGASYDATISADGHRVAFTSAATRIVTGDTNAVDDVFVRDLRTESTIRAGVNSQGDQPNTATTLVAMSANAQYLGFTSAASNLVSGDTNAAEDLFVRKRPGA